MDFVRRLIALVLLVVASNATAQQQCMAAADATQACREFMNQVFPGWGYTCTDSGSNTIMGKRILPNGGTSLDTQVAYDPDCVQQCKLSPGTETARGYTRSSISNGTLGCDRDSNCQTRFEQDENINIGGSGFVGGRFTTTGATCNAPRPDEPDPDDDVDDVFCEEQGDIKVCFDKDETCATAPSGRRFCWGRDSDPSNGCDHDEDDALCRDSPEPPPQDGRDDWRRDGGPTDVQRDGRTTTFVSYGNGPDEDGDGEGDDEDDDDDGDGTGDEDDDNEEERTASLTGCGGEPSCDGDPIDCAHYITSWRHRCDAADDRASGGAQCGSPPTCTGDPIQCAQLSQIWRLRCDHDGKVTGGTECSKEPTCEGDPLRCAIIRQQWLLRCRSSDVSGGETCNTPPTCKGDEAQCALVEATWRTHCQGVVSGAGNCTSQPTCDASSAQCASVRALWRLDCAIADNSAELPPDDAMFGDAGEPGKGVVTDDEDSWLSAIDRAGWGLSRSCPLIPTASMGAITIAMPVDVVCSAMSIFAAFVLLAGVMHAAYILGRT